MMPAGESVGNYRIVEPLGAGGMGVVYLAEHPLIGRQVAVKVILPELSRNPEIVTRFFNEARSSALIKHPGIIDVLDFGYHPSGSAYIVMELLRGESLGACLDREERLSEARAIPLVRQIAAALGAAHEARIIHRDLKPDNIYLIPDPELPSGERIKILDFGIAKLAPGASEIGKTRTGRIMGSPLYMSPEQCRDSASVDHRTDIYSLGCVAFQMVCGRPPFVATGLGEAAAMHLFEQPAPVRSIVPSISTQLESVIERALAKQADQRFSSMAELARALDGSLPAAAVATSFPSARPHDTTLSAAAAASIPFLNDRRRRSRRWRIALAGAALIGAVIGALALFPPAPRPAPSPTPAAPPVAVETTPPPLPPAASTVRRRIASRPPGANVYRAGAGAPSGTTPFIDDAAPTAGKVTYLVKLPGYRDESVELAADRDDVRDVTLVKIKPEPQKREKGQPLD